MGDFLYYERFAWFDDQIRRNRYPNAGRLAEHFEISKKQAQRTIAHLRDRLHAPLEYITDRRGYVYTDDSFELPRLPATQEEVLAVLLARKLLSHAAGGHISEQILRFGRKLIAGIGRSDLSMDELDRSFSAEWHGHSPVPAAIFRRVSDALLKHRLLRFAYRSPSTGEQVERTVEPHHLQHYQASWVLVAFCRLRGQWRTFYLARMQHLVMDNETFIPRPESEWKPHCEGAFGIFQGSNHQPVTLKFNAFRARYVRSQFWHKKQQFRELPGCGLEITFPVADFREVKMEILQFGGDCEVVGPAELRDEVRREIGKMAGIYGPVTSRPAGGRN